jgi:hypothetical protein
MTALVPILVRHFAEDILIILHIWKKNEKTVEVCWSLPSRGSMKGNWSFPFLQYYFLPFSCSVYVILYSSLSSSLLAQFAFWRPTTAIHIYHVILIRNLREIQVIYLLNTSSIAVFISSFHFLHLLGFFIYFLFKVTYRYELLHHDQGTSYLYGTFQRFRRSFQIVCLRGTQNMKFDWSLLSHCASPNAKPGPKVMYTNVVIHSEHRWHRQSDGRTNVGLITLFERFTTDWEM